MNSPNPVARRILWIAVFLYYLLYAPLVRAQEPLLGDLQEHRRFYPTPMTAEQKSALLNGVARVHPGWVLLRKETGNRCPAPNDKHISCDWLVYLPARWGYDVLKDQDTLAEPIWGGGAALSPESEIVLPWDEAPSLPAPDSPVEPPLRPIADTVERLIRIEMKLDTANGKLDAIEEKVGPLERVWTFMKRPEVASAASVLLTWLLTRGPEGTVP